MCTYTLVRRGRKCTAQYISAHVRSGIEHVSTCTIRGASAPPGLYLLYAYSEKSAVAHKGTRWTSREYLYGWKINVSWKRQKKNSSTARGDAASKMYNIILYVGMPIIIPRYICFFIGYYCGFDVVMVVCRLFVCNAIWLLRARARCHNTVPRYIITS